MSRYYNDELYHYGIPGMRWGIRRYQDRSGSLTPAGIRRYRSEVKTAKANRRERDRKIQERYDKAERKIESNYKRGQMLSKKDTQRIDKAIERAKSDWSASKQQYKQDKAAAKANNLTLSSRQKTALKVGAAAVATGLAVYGAHKILGGKHNASRIAMEKSLSTGKKAVSKALKSAKDFSVNKLKYEIGRIPDRYTRAKGETKKALKEGASKGVHDGAKIIGTGLAIYGAKKAIERRQGRTKAEEIIGYGRKPFPK